MNARLMLW